MEVKVKCDWKLMGRRKKGNGGETEGKQNSFFYSCCHYMGAPCANYFSAISVTIAKACLTHTHILTDVWDMQWAHSALVQ